MLFFFLMLQGSYGVPYKVTIYILNIMQRKCRTVYNWCVTMAQSLSKFAPKRSLIKTAVAEDGIPINLTSST